MVPSNVESSGGVCKSKKSKAAVLRKSADYCRRLMTECNTMLAEADALRAEMQALTADIKRFQEALPAEGMVPMTPGSSIPIDQMFSNYVQTQSLSKWKFWIFGRLTRPLFESFNRVVSISSIDAFRQSSVHWMRDYLSLVALRPVLLTGLRELVTSTSIMTNPERLECEVRTAILQESGLIAVTPAAATVTGPMPSSSTVAVSRQR
jgi:MAX-like protein X